MARKWKKKVLPSLPFLMDASRERGGWSVVTPVPFPVVPTEQAFKLSFEAFAAWSLWAEGLWVERPLRRVLKRLTKDVLFLKLEWEKTKLDIKTIAALNNSEQVIKKWLSMNNVKNKNSKETGWSGCSFSRKAFSKDLRAETILCLIQIKWKNPTSYNMNQVLKYS